MKRSRLTYSEIKRLKAKLLDKRRDILDTVVKIQDGMPSAERANGFSTPMDLEDMAVVNNDIEECYGLLESERQTLAEIDEALRSIEEGTYGLCQRCDDSIAKKRLQAIPWARYCLGCARQIEQEKSASKTGARARHRPARLPRLRWA